MQKLGKTRSNLETSCYICFEISIIPLSRIELVTTISNVEKLNLC